MYAKYDVKIQGKCSHLALSGYIGYTDLYRKHSINTYLINMTSIITVELFVTMAQLARGQTSVITVKIGARNGYKIISVSVKNILACINTLHPWE